MIIKKTITAAALILMSVMQVAAQNGVGLWGSAGVEKKVAKGFNAEVEVQYRQSAADMTKTDRWSFSMGLDKRVYRNSLKTFTVKAGAGYKYLKVYNDYSIKSKTDGVADGLEAQYYVDNLYNFNLTDSYKENRHRLFASLQASYAAGCFKFSLRESYQFTYSDSVLTHRDKYRYKTDTYQIKADSVYKGGGNKSVLRSRIGVSYVIPNSIFEPFVSYEIFSRIDRGWVTNKTRLSAGVEFALCKKNEFKLAYIYQNKPDDNESGGSIISLGYTFKF